MSSDLTMCQSIAQCAIQLESLCAIQLEPVIDNHRKRKAKEMEEKQTLARAFGIVTDAEKFVFLKYWMNGEGNMGLEVSPSVKIDYQAKNWQDMAKDILGNILWLLEEAQKPANEAGVVSEKEKKRVQT